MPVKIFTKEHLKRGMNVTVTFFGIDYEGEIVNIDLQYEKDSDLVLKSDEGLRYIPLNQNTSILITDYKEKKAEVIDYSELEKPELKKMVKNRGLHLPKNANKKKLMNLLLTDDKESSRGTKVAKK